MGKLEDKVAIITGAGGGMGRAMAERFAAEGAKVVVSDMDGAHAQAVVDTIKAAGGTAMANETNVTNAEQLSDLFATTTKAYGRLDILVNNAGIVDSFYTAGDASDELWDKIIAVNLTAPFKASRAAIKIMSHQESGGVILNISSVGGMFGARGGAAYVASKHGVIGLTRNIAATYGIGGKIRAVVLAPGSVATDIGGTIKDPDPVGQAALERVGGFTSPVGQPEDMANAAVFLVSDDAQFVNGAVLTADGGWTAG